MLETQRVLLSLYEAKAKRFLQGFPAESFETQFHPGPDGGGKQRSPATSAGLLTFHGGTNQPLRTEDGSTFTPGPMVEDTAMRWM